MDFLGAARVSVCVCVCLYCIVSMHSCIFYIHDYVYLHFFLSIWLRFFWVSGLKIESTQDGYCLLTEYMNFPILGSSYRGYPLVICYIAIEHGPFIVDYLLKIVIFHSYVSLPEGFFHGFIRRSCSYTVYDTPWYPPKMGVSEFFCPETNGSSWIFPFIKGHLGAFSPWSDTPR